MRKFEWLANLDDNKVWGESSGLLLSVYQAGLPVSPIFVASTEVFSAFFDQAKIRKEIERIVNGNNLEKNQNKIPECADEIRAVIRKSEFPAVIKKDAERFVKELKQYFLLHGDKELVLELSTSDENWQEQYVSVKSGTDLLKALKQVYIVYFNDQILVERLTRKGVMLPEAFSVKATVYQDWHGVGSAQSYDPVADDDLVVYIQATDGIACSGMKYRFTDEYRVDSKSLLILSKYHHKQWWQEKTVAGAIKHVKNQHRLEQQCVLTDGQIEILTRYVNRIKEMAGDNVLINWALKGDHLMITQVMADERVVDLVESEDGIKPYIQGTMLVPGRVIGKVRILNGKTDKVVGLNKQDIIVAESIKEKWLSINSGLDKAGGLVIEGNITASDRKKLVKLGIPCVYGTSIVASHLKEGQRVTMDAQIGAIYLGRLNPENQCEHCHTLVTGTKVMAYIDNPVTHNLIGLSECDGVGILRGEHIIEMTGMHPEEVIRRGMHEEYVELLVEGIESVARKCYPKPVMYHLHDLHSSPILLRPKGDRSLHEKNPKLGSGGARFYLDGGMGLDMEMKALRKIWEKGLVNVGVVLPGVRNKKEAVDLIGLVKEEGANVDWTRVVFWQKVESPAMAEATFDLSNLPIQAVVYEVDAIGQLLVGYDMHHGTVGHLYNQSDPAIGGLMGRAISQARQEGLAVYICAEQGDLKPELLESVVQAGVNGVIVPPGTAHEYRGCLASIEQRVILDSLNG